MLKRIIKGLPTLTTTALLLSPSLSWSALPQATVDDYVWELVPPDYHESTYDNDCEYNDDATTYQLCQERVHEQQDNMLSQQWGLGERVMRVKDTLYIKVPNRSRALTFRDSNNNYSEDSDYSFTLKAYDKARQLLILEKSLWETTDSISVDLKTGIEQEFEGTDLTFSPQGKYAATVETYPTAESVMLWQRQADGHYQLIDIADKFRRRFDNHLAFYNNDGGEGIVRKVTLEWLHETSLLVDFYFKINFEDSAAYRVRFNFVKPNPEADWQIIAVK